MSNSVRRNLRNSNTCPTIVNPLHQENQTQQLQSLVPTTIIDILKNMPQLSCNHLQGLPAFVNALSVEEALEMMRRAEDWQKRSMQVIGNITEKEEGERASIVQILPAQEESKKPMEERYARQFYFDDQLHEFINTPHCEL